MTMKNPSLSGAVALVGVGLVSLSAAIVFGGLGGAAHAGAEPSMMAATGAGQGGTIPPVPSGMPVESARHPGGRATTKASVVGDGCSEGPPLDWFGPIRPLPSCGDLGFPDSGTSWSEDVNDDGRPERFLGRVIYMDELIASGGSPLPDRCLLWLGGTALEGDTVTVTRSCLLGSQRIAEWILARTDSLEGIGCQVSGWTDVDSDGDLDLCLGFWIPGESSRRYAWLENTGFEASQPLAGDLNSDGNVNSADLALLLGGWTGG